MMVKGFLVTKTEAKVVEFEDGLDSMYKLVDCDLIDIVHREIGGKLFDLVIDDEGLLKDGKRIGAMCVDGDERLYGNILIVNHDGEGNTVSITDEDIEIIKTQLFSALNVDTGVRRPVLYYYVRR